jgi:hypothetical protein
MGPGLLVHADAVVLNANSHFIFLGQYVCADGYKAGVILNGITGVEQQGHKRLLYFLVITACLGRLGVKVQFYLYVEQINLVLHKTQSFPDNGINVMFLDPRLGGPGKLQ